MMPQTPEVKSAKPDKHKHCKFWESNDYVTASLTGFLGVGGGVAVTRDKGGNWYVSLVGGFGVGKGAGFSFGQLVNDRGNRISTSISNFLTGTSASGGGAWGVGSGVTRSDSSGQKAGELWLGLGASVTGAKTWQFADGDNCWSSEE
jgi:hypothetical protein